MVMQPKTLSDILSPRSVLVPLETTTRDGAIAALTDALVFPGTPQERSLLRDAVLARELVGSTGIGHGVAIPHARSAKVKSPLLAAGLAAAPIDFKSADGTPARLIFLLAVPAADYAIHLKVLAALSRMGSNKALVRRLLAAPDAAALFALLAEVSL